MSQNLSGALFSDNKIMLIKTHIARMGMVDAQNCLGWSGDNDQLTEIYQDLEPIFIDHSQHLDASTVEMSSIF